MEGNYSKILNASHDVPMEEYNVFLDILVDTVREEVAECAANAYKTLSSKAAKKMLMFETDDDLAEYCEQNGWKMDDQGVIVFDAQEEDAADIPAIGMVQKTIGYAVELEKIV
eukprot:TRINITY_DN1288_c0_g1_i4.p2 TRINITY_DN1288_c0_g1~~TRINITY_DN1288_c0_g1_i4.p2  ORF type:complete len:113 (+),score=53.70 TRINITY_DN1288_c0_g1_i4:183-521(+)